MKMKEESEKDSLNLRILKTKIMASGPITSWQIEWKQWNQWQTLFWGAPKSPFNITVIQVYAPISNAEEVKLNGSMKTYKTF